MKIEIFVEDGLSSYSCTTELLICAQAFLEQFDLPNFLKQEPIKVDVNLLNACKKGHKK